MKKIFLIISIVSTLSSCTSYSSDPMIIIKAETAKNHGDKRTFYEIWGFPFNHKFMSYSKFNAGDTVTLTNYRNL